MGATEKLLDHTGLQSIPIEKEPQLYRLSVDQYMQMIEIGLFHPERKVELIEGELIYKMGIGEKHAQCVNKLVKLFIQVTLDEAYEISSQNPIRLKKSRPEPDLVVQTRASWEAGSDPMAKDILLVIEVAHSSLAFDRDIKLPIYASNAINNYWIVNLEAEQVEVYSLPSASTYDKKRMYKLDEKISMPYLQKEIAVSDFLG